MSSHHKRQNRHRPSAPRQSCLRPAESCPLDGDGGGGGGGGLSVLLLLPPQSPSLQGIEFRFSLRFLVDSLIDLLSL